MDGLAKKQVTELAVLGGSSLFQRARSTSNLVRPDFEKFLSYSALFFEQKQYTNNGPSVRLLEERLAEFHEAEHCVTFCSGFWALAIAISVLARKDRAEILMPSLTYRRMADIAAWVRLKPRFCEVDSNTLAITAETARPCINNQTALIMGVHPIVNTCDVSGLVKLAGDHDLPILFDSVESVYETVPDGKVGRFGNAEVFSLHASKLLNGFEGGYITTNDPKLATQLRLLRGFGFFGRDNVAIAGGMNAKLNEIHAAMALASLDDLPRQVEWNRKIYRTYQRCLRSFPGIRLLEFDESCKTSYKNIVVELLDEWPLSRAETLRILVAEKVLARSYYSPALHQKKMLYPHIPAVLPVTEHLAERFMLMPCGSMVDTQDIERLVQLLSFISQNHGLIRERLGKAGDTANAGG